MEKSIEELLAELKATRDELIKSQEQLDNAVQRATKLAEEFAN
jgi:hypothetical protein